MTAGTPEDLEVLAAFAPALAATFASVASDIALVIDTNGVIRHRAVGEEALAASTERWVGRRWVDTVTTDTRHKIELLLQEVGSGRTARRREVSHPSLQGLDIPMAWAAIRLGEDGPVLAVGRDMRAVAAIQQRFVDAQQELERDYWKRRRTESHYELLFQVANDAVFVVDGETLRITEANAAAEGLLGGRNGSVAGQTLASLAEPASRPQVEELLRMARSTGRPAEVRVWLAPMQPGAARQAVDVSAVPVRAGSAASQTRDPRMLVLVRARQVAGSELASEVQRRFAEFVERTPDGIVIADSSGGILSANPAFLALTDAVLEDDLHGRPLQAVLGDASGTLEGVLLRVRQGGLSPAAQLRMPQRDGGEVLLEVSAILLAEGDQERVGFTIRRLARTLGVAAPIATRVAEALYALGTELDGQIGHRPLHALMDRAARVTEHHLIERAIERNGGDLNRSAAALGVSSDELRARRAQHALQRTLPPDGDTVS